MIICENNTVFAKSDFWSKTRQPAPVSPIAAGGLVEARACRNFILRRFVYRNISSIESIDGPSIRL